MQEALDAAQRLRTAAMTPNQRVSVVTPDGRVLNGAEAILDEAVTLEGRAELDTALGMLLLLVDIRAMLAEVREQVSNPPVIIDTQTQIFASTPGSIPHPGSATPEHAPAMPCPIPGYHSNHLWWGPPSKDGVYQPRLFCDGVRWQPPETAGP